MHSKESSPQARTTAEYVLVYLQLQVRHPADHLILFRASVSCRLDPCQTTCVKAGWNFDNCKLADDVHVADCGDSFLTLRLITRNMTEYELLPWRRTSSHECMREGVSVRITIVEPSTAMQLPDYRCRSVMFGAPCATQPAWRPGLDDKLPLLLGRSFGF